MWQVIVIFRDTSLAPIVFIVNDMDDIYPELANRKISLTDVDQIISKPIRPKK